MTLESEPVPEDAGPRPGAVGDGDPLAWIQDARRVVRLVQAEGLAVLRRSAPEVLDQVSELAGGLAAALRSMDAEPDPGPADGPDAAADPDATPGPPSGQHTPAARPPSTVRIDVTD